MANQSYNFKYVPLTGKLSGASMVQQTEQAINELAQIVNEGSVQVEVINNLVNQANDNAAEALTKATEALETSGRVYITLPNLDDADSYYDSQLYYFANKNSGNLPVVDTGFLEVKTNDTKTSTEQVFTAETSGTVYVRHGVISSDIVGEETVYSVLWDSWVLQANENYVSEEIRQHGNVPVGFEYFSMNPNIPQGSLPLLGGEYDRSTYQDLWAWVQEQTGYLKTEAEWQALSTANNGNVPYYSSGDGSTTFRVPSLRCWVKGTDGSAQLVGSYLAAGLPNIEGDFEIRGWYTGTAIVSTSKAFSNDGLIGMSANRIPVDSTAQNSQKISMDASRSNAIYGKSSTVQPESIVGMWLVKAYGTIVDTGSIDEQAYIDEKFAQAKQYTDIRVPTGCVQAFAGNTLPDGWLLCDGSAVDRTLYAALFTAIGTTYGSGNGSTTFNLPNLTDKFIEGSATSGTVKSAGLPNIISRYAIRGNNFGAPDQVIENGAIASALGTAAFNYVDVPSGNAVRISSLNFNASGSNPIYGNANTVQPPALTMRYIIKY